ncbi:hypothetical protein MPSEU_000819300 [Mayamaea pseudoterrestris]|nr:hypothetical protein MPSEU_000819300 [Mayamaea pseudoterrestris]
MEASHDTIHTKPNASNTAASDVFFDNLGKIFLAAIGLLVATLVRSYMGTNGRNRMRELLMEQASLDPLEIEDLRVANSEFDLPVFHEIIKELEEAFPHQTSITYSEFVNQVRQTMKRLKGDAFTIQLGHLLDRVVLEIQQDQGRSSQDPEPIALWMTVLSLALYSPVPERMQALFQVMQATASSNNDVNGSDSSSTGPAVVTMQDVRAMVGYLQCSHQLVPDAQVVATDEKFPIQKYAKGKPEDLFEWDGNETDEIDVDAFADVLRSTAVCAWGECYHRRK